jgi:hypothetical protein
MFQILDITRFCLCHIFIYISDVVSDLILERWIYIYIYIIDYKNRGILIRIYIQHNIPIQVWEWTWLHGIELDLQLPMQSVPITTDVVSLIPAQGEVYKIMWWSLSVGCGFLRILCIPPPIKVTGTIYLKYFWKWRCIP